MHIFAPALQVCVCSAWFSFIYLVLPVMETLSFCLKKAISANNIFFIISCSWLEKSDFQISLKLLVADSLCIKLGSFKGFTSLRAAEPKLAGVRGWKSWAECAADPHQGLKPSNTTNKSMVMKLWQENKLLWLYEYNLTTKEESWERTSNCFSLITLQLWCVWYPEWQTLTMFSIPQSSVLQHPPSITVYWWGQRSEPPHSAGLSSRLPPDLCCHSDTGAAGPKDKRRLVTASVTGWIVKLPLRLSPTITTTLSFCCQRAHTDCIF